MEANHSLELSPPYTNKTPMNITANGNHYRLPGLVTFCVYAGAIALLLSFLFSVLVVAAFFKRKRLITPFTIQFLNFVIIELCMMVFDGPLQLLCRINTNLFFDPVFCAFFKFGAWTFPSLALLQNMAIGLDRWSALLAPVWYRTKTVKFGVNITFGLVLGYLVLYLPLFAADTAHGVPHGQRCDTHHVMEDYQAFVRILTYYTPLGFVYLSYPILIVILRRRRSAAVRAQELRARRLTIPMSTHPFSRVHRVGVVSGRTDIYTLGLERSSVDPPQDRDAVGKPGRLTLKRFRRKKINLSMWMMLVQILCSVPLAITYTLIQNNVHLPYLDDVNVFNLLLTTINMLIDPIMYWIFFKDLREETFRLLRCQCS